MENSNNNIIQLAHFQLTHEKMQVVDAVLFLYEANFGGGRYILSSIEEKMENITHDESVPLYDSLGKSYIRLNLSAVKGKLEPHTVFRLTKLRGKGGSTDNFRKELGFLAMCFSEEDVRAFFDTFNKSKKSPISHSDAFKENYGTNYVVVSSACLPYLELLMAIDTKKPHLVGIDGRCASGKTTLSSFLEGIYDCNIFHADDYFLPPEKRTKERLLEAGGNMDRERLLSEVISSVKRKRDTVYRKFFCHDLTFSEPITVPFKSLTFIEGSYCLHPELYNSYDLRVFVDIDHKKQLKRIEKRGGKEALNAFENKWIPYEEKYFETFRVKENCDIVVNT